MVTKREKIPGEDKQIPKVIVRYIVKEGCLNVRRLFSFRSTKTSLEKMWLELVHELEGSKWTDNGAPSEVDIAIMNKKNDRVNLLRHLATHPSISSPRNPGTLESTQPVERSSDIEAIVICLDFFCLSFSQATLVHPGEMTRTRRIAAR